MTPQGAPAASGPAWAASQKACLAAVLERVIELKQAGAVPMVLFDLDDTVLSTNRRHARILREFAAERETAARWPEAAGRLSAVVPPPSAYSVTEIAKHAGIEDEEVMGPLREYWFARFFRSEYLLEDEVVPGAPEFCGRVAAAGGLLVYLTGRDESMRAGTEISLAQKGFPIPGKGRARLILKPRFDTPDLDFKHEAMDLVAAWGPVAAGFENEPGHVNLFADRFPDGRMVLLETKHSGKPVRPYPTVGRLRDFRPTDALGRLE